MRYSIRIQYPEGASYLWHRDKGAWCKRTATKYLDQWNAANPEYPATLETEQ